MTRIEEAAEAGISNFSQSLNSFSEVRRDFARNGSRATSRSSTISWPRDVGIGKLMGLPAAFMSEPEDVEAG